MLSLMYTSTKTTKTNFVEPLSLINHGNNIKNFLVLLFLFSFCLLSHKSFSEVYLLYNSTPSNSGQNISILPCLDTIRIKIDYGTSMDSVFFDFPEFFVFSGDLPPNASTSLITDPINGSNDVYNRITFNVNPNENGSIIFGLRYLNCNNSSFTFNCFGQLLGGFTIFALLQQPMTPIGGSAVNSPIIYPLR